MDRIITNQCIFCGQWSVVVPLHGQSTFEVMQVRTETETASEVLQQTHLQVMPTF